MTIAWFFEDERDEGILAVMQRVARHGAVVPSLWRLEVANVLRSASRRGRCDEAYVDRCLARLERLPIEVDRETDRQAWEATRTLSRDHQLTIYDAAYLEAAIRLRLALASLDRDLILAAERCRVEIVRS